jgi:hypothetical protein
LDTIVGRVDRSRLSHAVLKYQLARKMNPLLPLRDLWIVILRLERVTRPKSWKRGGDGGDDHDDFNKCDLFSQQNISEVKMLTMLFNVT